MISSLLPKEEEKNADPLVTPAPIGPIYKTNFFKDEVILITGGGTGIGVDMASHFVQLGAKVALCGRRAEPLAQAKEKLLKDFQIPDADIFIDTCDIRDEALVDAFVKKVLSALGKIDVLINNAGGQFPILAEHLNTKGFTAVIRNNLIGTWNMTSAVARLAMIPQKRGRIVNIIAQMLRGFPTMVHTGAARAGVDNLTKTLSVEWAPYNIVVNAIAPGIIVSSGSDKYGDATRRNAAQRSLVRRCGSVEEVTHLALFLSSWKCAGFICGQTFYVDGGQSIWGDLFDPWAVQSLKSKL